MLFGCSCEAVRPIAFQCLSSVFYAFCKCQLARGNRSRDSCAAEYASYIKQRREKVSKEIGGSYSPDYITGIEGPDQML